MPLSPGQSPILGVDSGLHRSARLPLPAGEVRVGAADTNAVVVSDLGVPCGFSLRRQDGAIVLQAVDAPIEFGRGKLRPGRGRAYTESVSFHSGGVDFRLTFPGSGSRAPTKLPQRVAVPAGLLAAGLAAATILTLAVAPAAAPSLNLRAASLGNAMPVDAPPVGARVRSTEARLVDDFGRQLNGAGLDGVTLRARGDGTVEATGQITSSQSSAWHDMARWFDTAARGGTVLVDRVAVAGDAPPLQIQAVWPGRNPYLVDGNGEKLFVGSALASGWSIHQIDAKRVLIKRGEQIVAVRF